jgi:predicted component of type VI protein secretion system
MFLHKHFGDGEVSEMEDIVRNLGHVLRTKRGAGYFLENFGLSDTGYRTPAEMVERLTREIAENVRLYEPRIVLLDVDEEYDDDGTRARLVVRFRLRSKSEHVGILFDFTKNAFDIVALPGKNVET